MNMNIEHYYKSWMGVYREGERAEIPCNESAFITAFIEHLEEVDYTEVIFCGEGAYYGKQIIIEKGPTIPQTPFEVCYSKKTIGVYSAEHHGFSIPNMILLEEGDDGFDILNSALDKFLRRIFLP